jgi:sarcosine oxidase subunit alpha
MKENRKQLVGLLTEDPNIVLEEGAQIVSELNQKPIEMLGHVTSSYFSPNLNKSIALAVVKDGKNMMGKKLFIPMENKNIGVTISNTIFYDEENKSINAKL